MIIRIGKLGTPEELNSLVSEVINQKTVKSLLIFACDENGFTPENVDPVLKNIQIPVFGGVFPEIIYGKGKYKKGTIVAGLPKKINVQIIPNLSDMNVNYKEIIDKKIPDPGDGKTMFVLVDGFSQRINALIDSLFDIFGLEFNYIGGGTGSLSMLPKPCLFTREGLIQDSAVLALSNIESGVGVSHGWTSISGPYRVTESDRNIIKTLDWEPAFKVYKEAVEKHSGKAFSDDNFFDIAKGYPFGIVRLNSEKIVRDPFMRGDDNSLVCVGEVPHGSFLDILTGDSTSLIVAARRARLRAEEAYIAADKDKTTMLFMDCISRVLFLEDRFIEELDAVYDPNIPLIGALTIGEIANNRKDYLEFYNKTSVISILGQ
ncbi:FIST signal transduction protein [Candidatus Margulisiibacteriota bacterium]